MLNILSWWTHFVSWPAWMSQLRTCPNQVLRNESSPESRPDVYHESWVKSWEEIQLELFKYAFQKWLQSFSPRVVYYKKQGSIRSSIAEFIFKSTCFGLQIQSPVKSLGPINPSMAGFRLNSEIIAIIAFQKLKNCLVILFGLINDA